MFDDDAAHFEKIVLAMPEPSRLLPVYEEARAALVALHENIVQKHAVYNTWVQQDEALALKRAPTLSRVATISGHLARWSLLDGSRVRLGPPAKRGAET